MSVTSCDEWCVEIMLRERLTAVRRNAWRRGSADRGVRYSYR